MANSQLARLLEFANMQMASEAFLLQQPDLGVIPTDRETVVTRLTTGNTHASRFTLVQANQFFSQYEVLAQYRNDPQLASGAGFSGTLFKSRETGELTLSFRSTEFIDDEVRDNKATNQLEIKDLGWAFGQISEMEAWYAQLRADPNLLGGKSFNVAGYSLGGHLATAFNILRRETFNATGDPDANPVINTYTFNGAGTGSILNGRRLTDLLADFNRIRANYTASAEWAALSFTQQQVLKASAQGRVDAVKAEESRVRGLSGIANATFPGVTAPGGSQESLDYQIAALLVARGTVGALASNPIPTNLRIAPVAQQFQNMIELVGMETDGLATSLVSNSGIHYGNRIETPIEAQPRSRGNFSAQFIASGFKFLVDNPIENDFGDTHSLVLIVDSLSLLAAFESLDPNLTIDTSQEILAAASNAKASSLIGTQGTAEGDTLERALDALRNLILGPGQEPTLDYEQTLEGNTWHLDEFRKPFQDNLAELNSEIDDLTEENVFEIESLADIDPAELAAVASGPDAIDYRYALRELNPFVVVGDSADEAIYESHNAEGQLDLYEATGETRALTGEWIADRAEFLAWKTYRNIKNIGDTSALTRQDGLSESQVYTDVDSDTVILVQGSPLDVRTAYITFGSDGNDTGAGALIGGSIEDHLYGGDGDDALQGNHGNDYLEGGSGNDTYVWNTGDGFDTILDTDGVGKLIVNGRLVSGSVQIAQNDYISTDKQLTLHFEDDPDSGGVLIVNGDIRIEDFVSGDLGITLSGGGDLAEIQATTTVFVKPFSSISPALGFGTDGADFASGTEAIFVAKGGNDLLEVSGDEYAEFYAGPGDDVIAGGGLSPQEIPSVLMGDAGSDIILGGDNDENIHGDIGFVTYSRDNDFSFPSFFYFGSSGEGYWDWGRNFLEVDFSELAVEPFRGTPSEALSYALGIADDSDLNTFYDDYIDGGGGNDRITGGNGSDVLFGGDGNDILIGDGFSLIPTGVFQTPQWILDVLPLLGAPGDDYLDGGPGNDMLGDDPIRVGLDSMGGSDVLIGGEGNDILTNVDPASESQTYTNYLDGGEGDDILQSSNESIDGFDTLVGGLGNDQLTLAGRSNAYMDGGPGNDTLTIGVLGNASVNGGTGSDSYTVTFYDLSLLSSYFPGVSPGGVVISEHDEQGSDFDTLSMNMLSIGEIPLSITRDESNLYVGTRELPQLLTVENWFTGTGNKLETISISFTDFSATDQPALQVYDIAAIENRFSAATTGPDFLWGSSATDQLAGGLGDDALFGAEGNDTLAGNEGDDTLDGGEGSDVYVFNMGDGIDHVVDTGRIGSDGILFGAGITRDMLAIDTDSLVVSIGSDGDAIHLGGAAPSDAGSSSNIEYFRFADGTTLSYQQLVNPGLDLEGIDDNETAGGAGSSDSTGGLSGGDTPNDSAGSGSTGAGASGGSNRIDDIAGDDPVRVGPGIEPSNVSGSGNGGADALDIGTSPFSPLWQIEQGYQFEQAQVAGGMARAAQDTQNQPQYRSQFDSWYDDPNRGQYHDSSDNRADSSEKNIGKRDDSKYRYERDRIADLLDAYLAHEPRYDFGALESDPERDGRRETVLTPVEIAQRWERVGRYVNGLSDERDENARQGVGELLGFDALNFLAGGGFSAVFGHAGSTGATRGYANLKTLQGLEEGFHRLALG
jgi:Ca2+-binding RTX toxin-like protein